MQSRKSKKTRSYGEAPTRTRTEAHARISPSISSRPRPGDRTHSEPVVPQVAPTKERHNVGATKANSPTVRRYNTIKTMEQNIDVPIPSPKSLPELSFAVIGAQGSGKSTFVRCALDLKKPATSPISTKKMSLEDNVFLIRLVEIPIHAVKVAADLIQWPEEVEEQLVPRIDGVLAIYDVTERQSFKDIPRLLVTSPTFNSSSPRTRAMTISQSSNALDSSRLHNTKTSHGRATSELTRSRSQVASPSLFPPRSPGPNSQEEYIIQDSGTAPDSGLPSPSEAVLNPDSSVIRGRPGDEADLLSCVDHIRMNPIGLGLISENSLISHTSASMGTPATSTNSLSEILDEASQETRSKEETSDTTDVASDSTQGGEGLLLDELIDRLLSPAMSKSDAKFAAVFLCLYRKFAAPAQLLSGIIRRFESLVDNDDPQLIRTSCQLRYLGVLAQWVEEYPGDFAHALTRQQMSTFITQTSNNRIFAIAAKEMAGQIDTVMEDDDTDWACSDTSRGRANTLESFSSVLSMRGLVTAMLADNKVSESSEDSESTHNDSQGRQNSVKHSKTPSSASSVARSGSQSAASFSFLSSSLEAAQRQAELLTPSSRVPLTKEQWHLFMDTSDEDIAREMTRIDWIMYTSIRPRDLIRHVSLSAEQKDKCKGLEHVHRMINQFNHVAFWVANIVLLRDKPKHRAKALEKFMGIAWKLRQMNNYNSLGAVVAGINGIAVHRLGQTRELVSQQAQREFMRLEILMGTQKSHFAYRLAWENTTTERIPFLPLHRRDLVSAEAGNRTFVGEDLDRINWRKFEIMGDVVVGIQRSQGTPYPNISRNIDIQRLILECKFSKDDDELYERSIQVEKPGVGENTRKRFNWFQR